MLTASASKIVSDINEMFARYGPTFVDLAIGKRSDMDAILAKIAIVNLMRITGRQSSKESFLSWIVRRTLHSVSPHQ